MIVDCKHSSRLCPKRNVKQAIFLTNRRRHPREEGVGDHNRRRRISAARDDPGDQSIHAPREIEKHGLPVVGVVAVDVVAVPVEVDRKSVGDRGVAYVEARVSGSGEDVFIGVEIVSFGDGVMVEFEGDEGDDEVF